MLKKLIIFILIFFLVDLGVAQFLEGGLFRYYGLATDYKIALIGIGVNLSIDCSEILLII
jgi:hypothetical protein